MFQHQKFLRGFFVAAFVATTFNAVPFAARASEADDYAKEATGHIDKAVAALKAMDYAGAVKEIETYRAMGVPPAPRALMLEARAAAELGEFILSRNLVTVFLASDSLTDDDKKIGNDLLSVIGNAADNLAQEEYHDALLHPEGKSVRPTRDPAQPILIPPYPIASLKAKEEGRVVLDIFVARNGRTIEAKVQTTSGFPKLDQAAVDTAMTSWRFKPGTVDETPVAMWFPFAFRFTLPADAAAAAKK